MKKIFRSDLNLSGFLLSSANKSDFLYTDVEDYSMGSIQVVWKNATSSDGFTSKGTLQLYVSDNAINDEPLIDSLGNLVKVEISAASGSVFIRKMKVDWSHMRWGWTKNNNLDGQVQCFGIFKNIHNIS